MNSSDKVTSKDSFESGGIWEAALLGVLCVSMLTSRLTAPKTGWLTVLETANSRLPTKYATGGNFMSGIPGEFRLVMLAVCRDWGNALRLLTPYITFCAD